MRLTSSFVLTLFLAVSCSAAGSRRRDAPARPEAGAAWASTATSTAPAASREEDPIVRVNRTLIYPVRWGRAEDLAATLEPLLLGMYGPGVRIVPQRESNRLLIYLPSRQEQEAVMQRSQGRGTPPAARGPIAR
jgi:hypothetical protein